MRITTLVENTKISDEYENKHGLSFHIETEKHNILFDLGPKNTFLTNAKKLNINYLEDDFVHEQSLIITENNKNVLMGGCAHNDIRNIIDKAEVIIGKDLDYVISGFHIFNPSTGISESDLFINTLGDNLNKRNTKFYTCHCTGMRAFKMLEEKLQDKIKYISTGQVLNI